ncbi:MAG: hypothetical protein VW600_09835 [Ferrovibrio sp.]
MPLFHVRLELAREKDHPEGSTRHGYDIVLPLKPDGHLDAAEWKAKRASCNVHRFWHGEDDQHGELIHTRRGQWALSYDPSTAEDDESLFRMDSHQIRQGEYLSLSGPDGQRHTFRIATVTPA